MEVLFAIPLLVVPFIIPFITGAMAESFGRKFWPWFILGICLPFLGTFILLCLPNKAKRKSAYLAAIISDETLEHLSINSDIKKINGHENDLPATA